MVSDTNAKVLVLILVLVPVLAQLIPDGIRYGNSKELVLILVQQLIPVGIGYQLKGINIGNAIGIDIGPALFQMVSDTATQRESIAKVRYWQLIEN